MNQNIPPYTGQQPSVPYGQPAPYGQPVSAPYGQPTPTLGQPGQMAYNQPGQVPYSPVVMPANRPAPYDQSGQVNYGQPGQMPVNQPAPYGQPAQMPYGQAPMVPKTQITWMQRPVIPNCPPGLEYLTQIDQLLIKQNIDYTEMLLDIEMNNRYSIKNVFGQTVYHACEDTNYCTRQFCGPERPFTIHVMDNLNHEVIQIRRSYRCLCITHCISCMQCCQDEIEVESPPGFVIGYVKQLYEGCYVRYSVMNENRETILRIHGPTYFYCTCPGDEYPLAIVSADGMQTVGKVSKQWSNLFQEYFTDADNFGVQFPLDLDVKVKAVILGAVFLIDFMFFEDNNRNRDPY